MTDLDELEVLKLLEFAKTIVGNELYSWEMPLECGGWIWFCHKTALVVPPSAKSMAGTKRYMNKWIQIQEEDN